ncbi:MAG: hypothetical protein KatS3mg044_1140 [Rhodothermaceae bacterium]|nr:MAG: hypothetical protein KatS3mg044_1140 [Rhodothermaceae bacterium]
MPVFPFRLLPSFALFAGCLIHPVSGQPFERMELVLAGTVNVNHSPLHTFWQARPGVELSVSTPFYRGRAEAGGILHPYTARTAEVPSFSGLLLFAGWGLRVPIAPRLAVEGGARLGNYRMTFDDDTFPGLRTEHELTVALRSTLIGRLHPNLSLYVAGNYMKSYTFIRLKLLHVSAGLRYTFRTPDWLKTFLQ